MTKLIVVSCSFVAVETFFSHEFLSEAFSATDNATSDDRKRSASPVDPARANKHRRKAPQDPSHDDDEEEQGESRRRRLVGQLDEHLAAYQAAQQRYAQAHFWGSPQTMEACFGMADGPSLMLLEQCVQDTGKDILVSCGIGLVA